MRAGRERPRLEVGQQPRVLLGLLGDPVDRRRVPGLDLAQRRPGRPPARGLGVDRVAVRAGLRVAEHLVEPCLDPRRDRALEPRRLLVRFGPAEARRPRSAATRAGRGGGRSRRPRPGRRSSGASSRPSAWRDEPVGDQPPEHLARGLGGHAEVAADLGGRDAPGRRTGHHAQREQVLLGGADRSARRDVGHGRQDTGLAPPADAARPRRPTADREADQPGHDAGSAPSTATRASRVARHRPRRRQDRSDGRATASATSDATMPRRLRQPGSRNRTATTSDLDDEQRSTGDRLRRTSRRTRPQPVSSPTSQPSPTSRSAASR